MHRAPATWPTGACAPHDSDQLSTGAGSLGSSDAQGIEQRDGFPVSAETIFCCDGASAGVHLMMRTLLRDERDGMLCPIPQCAPRPGRAACSAGQPRTAQPVCAYLQASRRRAGSAPRRASLVREEVGA